MCFGSRFDERGVMGCCNDDGSVPEESVACTCVLGVGFRSRDQLILGMYEDKAKGEMKSAMR